MLQTTFACGVKSIIAAFPPPFCPPCGIHTTIHLLFLVDRQHDLLHLGEAVCRDVETAADDPGQRQRAIEISPLLLWESAVVLHVQEPHGMAPRLLQLRCAAAAAAAATTTLDLQVYIPADVR